MKTNKFLMIAFGLCMLILGSCGSSVKNDPVSISEAVVKCLNDGDLVGIKQFLQPENPIGKTFDGLQEAYNNPTNDNKRLVERAKRLIDSKYTLCEQDVREDKATIVYDQLTSDNVKDECKIYLVNVDGKWYVKFIN